MSSIYTLYIKFKNQKRLKIYCGHYFLRTFNFFIDIFHVVGRYYIDDLELELDVRHD